MATPTKSQTVTTPKNHLSTTPSRLMASPRLGNSNSNSRPLAYKSPAVKTPASIQSQTHYLNASSHPASTPLAAVAMQDDLLGLSSPAAALLGSIAPTGLTPLPNGTDGLGITPHFQSASGQETTIIRNPELEKIQRLQQVIETLQKGRTGRGISRESVERVAKQYGFTPFWDEANLTIAGTRVDLEVLFDSVNSNSINNVILQLNTSEGDELQPQKEASEVLKGNLGVDSVSAASTEVESLENFSANLKLLSQLDNSDLSTNRFQIMGNLYETFKSIWNGEKQRKKWRHEAYHIREGNVGRPRMHHPPRLGLSVDYWTNEAEFKTTATETQSNPEDSPSNSSPNDQLWKARFSCTPGQPSILSQKWLSDEVLLSEKSSENPLDSEEPASKPVWLDSNSSNGEVNEQVKAESEDMDLDKPTGIAPSLNTTFICILEPKVLLPINVVAGLNVEGLAVHVDQDQTLTYHKALQQELAARDEEAVHNSDSRWARSIPVFQTLDKHEIRHHSYALYSASLGNELWCYPLTEIRLNHPRQFAAALPVLRQYVTLWSLMRSLTDDFIPSSREIQTNIERQKKSVSTRSNKKSGNLFDLKRVQNRENDSNGRTYLPVDVSLDLLTNPTKPRLDVLLPRQNSPTAGAANKAFLQFSVQVELGGILNVSAIRGLPGPNIPVLKIKLGQVLTLSEDLGVGVEWLLSHIEQ